MDIIQTTLSKKTAPQSKVVFLALLLILCILPAQISRPAAAQNPPPAPVARYVAITFDDLPGQTGGLVANDLDTLRPMTEKLVTAILESGAPVVGFVNEGKLYVNEEQRPPIAASAETERPDVSRRTMPRRGMNSLPKTGVKARRTLLDMWADAGFELGNHTYSHVSLNTTGLEQFETDVERGETFTRALMQARGKTLRYFRHPYLHPGLTLEKKRAFESWLTQHNYTIAPVTMDNDEYIYAAVYADALRKQDDETARRIGEDYLRYMEESTAFWEQVELHVVGRPIRHVLLLHANTINADYFPRLVQMLRRRGYGFISLSDALKDPAYALPDTYVGEWGNSWLHRWAVTAGKKRLPDPDPPAWITKAYEQRSRP